MRLAYYATFVLALTSTDGQTARPNLRCGITEAQYTAGDEHSKLSFVRLASKSGVIGSYGVHIQSEDPRVELWYYFDQGSAPRIALISTTNPTLKSWRANPDGGIRPHGVATFIGMNENGDLSETAPSGMSSLPKFIIIPELGQLYKSMKKSNYHPSAFVYRGC